MKTNSPKSFGAQLHKAQNLVVYIRDFDGYNPPREQEQLASMTTLVNGLVTLNDSEAAMKENYSHAAFLRAKAFRRSGESVEKLLPCIRGAVEAQYGKHSIELSIIAGYIRRMRTSRPVCPVAEPDTATEPRAVSRSERSYGAVAGLFRDIISALSQFQGYNPAADSLKIDSLQALADCLDGMSDNIAQATVLLKNARTARIAQYKELAERVTRIKAYVKAQYGYRSLETTLINQLHF
ncbi:MAG: hypothetical protein WCM76_00565 [Bacteroidota bacterium]